MEESSINYVEIVLFGYDVIDGSAGVDIQMVWSLYEH